MQTQASQAHVSTKSKLFIYLLKRHALCDDILTGWWNDTFLSLAFVRGGSTKHSSPQPWLHKVLGQTKITSSWACAPLCHANSILRYFGIINWVDGVNWSPLKFSKLTFRALALPQSEMFLRYSLWCFNTRNVSFENLSGSQFIVSQLIIPNYLSIPSHHAAPQFLQKFPPSFIMLYFTLSRKISNNN